MTEELTRRRVIAATGASLALAGCVGGSSDDSGGGSPDTSDATEASDQTDDAESGMSGADSTSADRPDWYSIQLEDVTTDEQFTLADIDEPVVIHTFATYCPTCNDQQEKLAAGYDDLSQQATLVDLSIDENDDPEDVRTHAKENNLDWRFGVAPNELTRELVDEFGQEVGFYSQSPLMILCPNGNTDTVKKGSGASKVSDAIDSLCG